MHFPDIWKALEAMKRQDGLGASPKWQRRPERPYDSGTDSDINSDRESLESLLRRFHCGLERQEGSEKGGWTRCISNLGKLADSWNGYLESLQSEWALSVHHSGSSRLTILLNQTVCIAYHASTLGFFRFGTVSEASIFKMQLLFLSGAQGTDS